MTLKKFAAAQVLDARIARQGTGLMRDAHRHTFNYDPKPGFLYVRSRAISSRTNDNFDHFPAEEIKKAYRTFVGKPVFVNHHNENHRRARGVIVDAALHEDVNPDGSPDTWAEVLMEVDAVNFPKLAQAILAGEIDRTSMGTDVAFSVCSVCNNKASTPLEYCQHIPRLKGKKVRRRTASGEQEEVLVYEKCYGLGFFENSLLVEQPADPTAYFLGVDARGLQMAASKVATEMVPSPLDPSINVPDYIAEAYYIEHPYARPLPPSLGPTPSGGDLLNPNDPFDGEEPEVTWTPDLLNPGDPGHSGRDLLAHSKVIEKVAAKEALNETLAPAKVDTLRDEQCPVCGEADSYDGDKCRVCGFIRPPAEFMDPDLEKAKQVDLRQDKADAAAQPGGAAPQDLPANTNAPHGHPLEDGAAQPDYMKQSIPKGQKSAPGDPAAAGSTPLWQQKQRPKDPAGGSKAEPGQDAAGTPLWKQRTRRKSAGMVHTSSRADEGDVHRGSGHRMLAVDRPRTAERVRVGLDRREASSGAPGDARAGDRSDPGRDDGRSRAREGMQAQALREPRPSGGGHAAGEHPPSRRGSGLLHQGSRVHPGEHSDARQRPHLPEVSGGLQATLAGAPAHGEGEDVTMRPALAALAEQQQRIDRLEGAVTTIATLAGLEGHPAITALRRQAADENPAQPSGWANPGGAGSETPAATTEEASKPSQGTDSPEAVGEAPNNDVQPDAKTSLDSNETVLDTPLDLNEQDPTKQVAGTDTLGEGERGNAGTNRTETDVRAGTPSDNGPAFAETGWTNTSAKQPSEGRLVASIRLARARINAGIASGDDLGLGATIASSDMSDEAIQNEINTISQVAAASVQRQAVADRRLVPQAVSGAGGSQTVARMVPSMVADPEIPQQRVAYAPTEDEMIFE